ncbi:growth hormone secretagogue receptor type 1-like [Dreissena polymorpha]|uniref:G-protein coupled receptors family 1 profile domain-containing protein n=1 Tax=Dreissena polymorpha TaxID=45954 RepID=A0A9D4KN58_DREPO|nr:growth hormone secretagogue receptor type 1-like [Dreissena polymorpha]KAH3842963.1 hypothetical protein DPMN_116469 [Dreissena polymorpha]
MEIVEDQWMLNSSLMNISLVTSNSSLQNLSGNVTNDNVPLPNASPIMQAVIDVFLIIGYIIQPLFLVVGVTGNMLTVVTMISFRFKDLTSRYILLFLSFSDSVLLITQPLNKFFVIKQFGMDLRALSSLSCKIFFVIFRSAKMTSSWLVVLLCFERYVAVVFPLKAKFILRKNYILAAIVLDYVIITTYNSIWHFSSGIQGGICKPDLPSLQQSVFVTIGVTFYSFIPTIILLVLTPQIVFRLFRHAKMRQALKGNLSSAPNSSMSANKKQIDTNLKASVMVIGVLISYVILVIPISTVHIYSFTAGFSAFDANSVAFFVFREISQILEQINYAINFFIYVVCSRQFRQRLNEILRCSPHRPSKEFSKRRAIDSISAINRSISDP